jgi:hypothetical protein
MGKINVGRVILGGVVAGVIADLVDYPIDVTWLGRDWAVQMNELGKPDFSLTAWMGFWFLGILGGLCAVWIYAAIRPRFGPGLKTAIYAGLMTWFLGMVEANVGYMYFMKLFTVRITIETTIGGFFEVMLGTLVGAWLYKEA